MGGVWRLDALEFGIEYHIVRGEMVHRVLLFHLNFSMCSINVFYLLRLMTV